MTTEELFVALQEGHPEGIVALTLPDSSERIYLWWGDRTLGIGLAGRIIYAINRELEEWEEEITETGVCTLSDVTDPLIEAHHGQYL